MQRGIPYDREPKEYQIGKIVARLDSMIDAFGEPSWESKGESYKNLQNFDHILIEDIEDQVANAFEKLQIKEFQWNLVMCNPKLPGEFELGNYQIGLIRGAINENGEESFFKRYIWECVMSRKWVEVNNDLNGCKKIYIEFLESKERSYPYLKLEVFEFKL